MSPRPRLVLLDEPTSQLDPVAGDELIWLLRRLNEEWGVSILLAEHRLERCLAAADRVIAMDSGAIAFDGRPATSSPGPKTHDTALETPAARLSHWPGIEPLPVGVRDARRALLGRGTPPPRQTAGRGATAPSASRTAASPLGGRRDPARQPSRFAICGLSSSGTTRAHEVLKGIDLRDRRAASASR